MADGNFPIPYDFKEPDVAAIFRVRIERLQRIRADPKCIPALKAFYKLNPAQFITDWGCTFDPRNVERGLPAVIPFILFERQVQFVDWAVAKWKDQRPGLVEKSRDMGMSWLTIALACTLCLHNDGMVVGFGSRKEEYVDRIGEPKSLFWKAREFMRLLPVEFRGGFDVKRDAPFMRISFPETGSSMTGEAGDNIGRGGRASIYFVDEAAYLEHPAIVDAALSQTTNCQIDLSSVNGMANAFAVKRHKAGMPEDYVFIFDWRDDPRKDDAWYAKQCEDLDPVIVAQEIDRDYAASVEGVVIPGAWVRSALDAHLKLGLSISGAKFGAFDVADEGRDANAFCGSHGFVVEHISEWSGKGGDIFKSTEHVFGLCDDLGYDEFRYDADGVGADVRGNARVINDRRREQGRPALEPIAFRGSGPIFDPKGEDVKGRKNEDYFQNAKAQGWWRLRILFRNIHRWVTEGVTAPVEDIICISTKCGNWQKLVGELSQATYTLNGLGKIVVDKTPEGAKSPNLADAVMIRHARLAKGMKVSSAALQRARR